MARNALAVAFVVGAQPVATQAQTVTDTALRLARSEMATIALQENPSTGYRWQLDPQGSSQLGIVAISDLGFVPGVNMGSKPLLGAPGQHRWRIEGREAGRATVIFIYSRPWEQTPPTRRHKVTVDVAGP